MLIVDMQMSKNVELRAPNGWFCSSSLFFAMYLHLCSKLSSLAIFFFYLSSRWCLHNFPRLVNKLSLSDLPFGSRCPLVRHTFLYMVPLPIQLLLRARCASSTSFARELCTGFDHNPIPTPPHTQRSITWVCNFIWTLTWPPPQPQPHPIPSVASRGCATSDER